MRLCLYVLSTLMLGLSTANAGSADETVILIRNVNIFDGVHEELSMDRELTDDGLLPL